MRVFIGNRKRGTGMSEYGLSVYGGGKLLFSTKKHVKTSDSKFGDYLQSLLWGANIVKARIQNKKMTPEGKITFFVESKQIYDWLAEKAAPREYVILLGSILTELSFYQDEVEIIYSKTTKRRVLYKETEVEEMVRVTDLFT